jgi:predicted Zn-dependent protease
MRVPAVAAPYVPPSWEKKFGDSLVGDYGGRFCTGPGGQAALDKLALRLSPGAKEMKVRVVSAGIVNAAAFPGGNILIFDELLKQADGPDELAGVLAHEIAHVEERHTTETMIRQLGIGIFVAGFGGTTGANVETLLSASYSRGSEAEADEVAIEALRRANISPLGTAGFFERLAKQEGALGGAAQPLSYLSSHPMSAERQKQFRDSAVKGRAYRPALAPAEWEALTKICSSDPDREKKRIQFFF